jgi:MraZ protein
LRAAAGLNRDLMLLGMGSHFEIWDKATLEAHERTVIAGGMPESVANLSF